MYILATPSPPTRSEPREEPEKIRKWREEQIKRLEEKGIINIIAHVNFSVTF